jgi:hypothetical protein
MNDDVNQLSGVGRNLPITGVSGGAQSTNSMPPDGSAAHAHQISHTDLDQEWVNKAKEVVERTKNDPFTLTKELSKVKAEYLKTRYNKEIKADENNS